MGETTQSKTVSVGEGNSNALPAISAHSVSKTFGAIRAVRNVSLKIARGTVHALVGANGAGKSTLMSILAGRIRADTGELAIDGQSVVFDTPRAAHQAGICSIYQELTIVPTLSAKANVFLGQEMSRRGWLSETAMDGDYRTLCRRLGVSIPPGTVARRLSLADQQALEIMRGLASRAHIMLFDEPTTALAPAERDALFNAMRGLRREGVTILLVSHNLEEVLDISDDITVFRDGQLVATQPRAAWTKRSLVHAMIGREVTETEAVHRPRPAISSPTALAVSGVNVPGAIEEAEFEVRRGEILGLGGLVGSGRTSLLRALAGLEHRSSGKMTIGTTQVAWPRTPRQAIDYGIALVPEDRKTQGLIGQLSAIDNLSLADLSRASRLGFIKDDARESAAKQVAKSFGFDPLRLKAAVRTLSGGNQQKILLARWGYKVPRVLLIDEPTRGIDVGAKEEILATIRRLAAEGLSILLVSSEIEEVVGFSDRVAVLSGGRVVKTFLAGREFGVSDVMSAAFGE
jgi:ABC-type sugar transport system ATPase subunit